MKLILKQKTKKLLRLSKKLNLLQKDLEFIEQDYQTKIIQREWIDKASYNLEKLDIKSKMEETVEQIKKL